jgi:hypothetical protein
MTEDLRNPMTLQREEFDAQEELSVQWNRLKQTPVVDDDYPEVRFDYERALEKFIKAMKANKRFAGANRYGVYEQ